jgi:hypothetical protein
MEPLSIPGEIILDYVNTVISGYSRTGATCWYSKQWPENNDTLLFELCSATLFCKGLW